MNTDAKHVFVLPHVVVEQFLDTALAADLLNYAIDNQALFRPTGVNSAGQKRIDPKVRSSVGTNDLGPFRQVLESRLLDISETLYRQTQTSPVPSPRVELDLVAHNDGAFYRRHIDTRTGSDARSVRVLTCVYYFNVEPKTFTGGALRLYAIGDATGSEFVDIEPRHNMLLAFPSWVPHEVMPVSCSSELFGDSRFAINGWIHLATGKSTSQDIL